MTHDTSSAVYLDELLLDLATVIELSDNDRKIADRRFGLLKTHLQRPGSPLRDQLSDTSALIYAQGSMAIGATIVSGTEDDRFDVDALIDMKVPTYWADDEVLDKLEEALKGFPGVRKIVRCTRCVQLQFAFMHMDVTILDPMRGPRQERVGEIFHSPDKGEAYRVPSNPYGFSTWYRRHVASTASFAETVRKRRHELALDRLATFDELARVDQEDLPGVVPPRLDAQEVVSLKLMKRYLNLRYCGGKLKRPPSIYLTKKSADCGYAVSGLTSQLEQLAACIYDQMTDAHLKATGPEETNPAYSADRINDRWPTSQQDRIALRAAMDDLLSALARARTSSVGEIKKILSELFGERVSTRAFDAVQGRKPTHFVSGTGTILTSAAARSAPIPEHRFHTEIIRPDK